MTRVINLRKHRAYKHFIFTMLSFLVAGCSYLSPVETVDPSTTQAGTVEKSPTTSSNGNLAEASIIAEVKTVTPESESLEESEPSKVQLPLTMSGEEEDEEVPPESTIQPTSTAAADQTPEAQYPVYDGPPLNKDAIGVQIHLHREDQEEIFNHLLILGVGWVKVQVSWKLYEPSPDIYDDFRFDELDRLVARANIERIKVLLSVAKAPEWSRPTTELDGPPSDVAHFQDFMMVLANRYGDKVVAYELWNEPNLRREWNGFPLDPQQLVSLIQAGADGVRSIGSQATLISAAPAPTGINDAINAVDDRQYLESMIAAGLEGYVDAVGVHPYGWANPADSRASDPVQTAPSHNNHPSFFFADTMTDYRLILDQAGYSTLPLWATEFGWGSYDGFGIEPPAGLEYMSYVNQEQQAAYTLQAFGLANEWSVAGPLILWNLNFAPTFGIQFVESAYSLLGPDGQPRPIYNSLITIPKAD